MPSEVEVPEEVERFDPVVTGGPTPSAPRYAPNTVEMVLREYDGEWVKYTDLPKIIEQARSQERQRVREARATVRGHLEGYADVIALTRDFDRGFLVAALRDDAKKLDALDALQAPQPRSPCTATRTD